jgi:ActR/RegA family two-component response regulator
MLARAVSNRPEQQMDEAMIEDEGAGPGLDARSAGREAVAAGSADAKAAVPFALIIDDQEPICQVVAMALTQLGVESASYRTAGPAIASLDQRQPAIVFLDVALEQSDAIDVIKGLSEKHYKGIVQLMSGGRAPLLEAIQRIGARFGLVLPPPLRKPFRRDDIRDAIAGAGLAGGSPISTASS